MSVNKSFDIYSITASSIDRYLQLNGWLRDYEFKNKNLMVYKAKDVQSKIISLPINEKYDDFYDVVDRILPTISKYEDRSLKDIIKDILMTFVDRLEFRILSDLSKDGKLPIEYAADCIEGVKDLFLYSTCAELIAQPICYRASEIAKDHLNNYKMAQTEKGSFVINVDIKVVDENNEQMVLNNFNAPTPLEHKVVKRIANAISQIDDIVQQKQQISYLAEYAYETGITANMCDALLKLRPTNDNATIETTIRYASAITQKTGLQDKLKINTMHFLAIDELGKVYRDKTIVEDVVLTGVIRSLSTKEVDEGIEKSIRLYTLFDGKARTISIELDDEQHRIACDAYRDGMEVKVSGELDMSGRMWIMTKVIDFDTI